MTKRERTKWVSSLKAGDKVGIYDRWGDGRLIYEAEVVRRTAGGKIRIDQGKKLFREDGTVAASGLYSDRVLGPVT